MFFSRKARCNGEISTLFVMNLLTLLGSKVYIFCADFLSLNSEKIHDPVPVIREGA